MNIRPQQCYEFGPFQLDTANHCLLREGQLVPLTPKVIDLLEVLVQNNGRLIEKEELLKEVWPDSFVEEGNVNRNISIIRKVLGDDATGKAYIETVPKRGYRFVASVRTMGGNGLKTIETEQVERDSQVDAPLRQKGNDGPKRSFTRRWVSLGGLVALTLGTIVYVLTRGDVTSHPEIKSIAVLPLQNLSGDPAKEYFADGMTEALISGLAQIRALRVISRTSVMSFKGIQKPLPEIARELKVDGVIEGSVQRENGRVKVMIQLIHGPTDTHLWARDYERELTDVLKLQGEVARAIAQEIRIQVTPEEGARLASATTVNPVAHQEYLTGRYHLWRYNEEDLKRAIDYFERAIQIDPKYAAAYAGLSHAWWARGIFGRIGFREAESPSRAAARKALELDDRLAEAYVVQADVKRLYDWDWTGAEDSVKRALELDPNNLDAHNTYSILLHALGRFPEAIAQIERAAQRDPLAPQIQSSYGRILYRARRFDEAILRLNRAIELDARNYGTYGRLGDVYEQMGRYPEAVAFLEKARALANDPGSSDISYKARLARVYARMGRRSEARQMLEGLKSSGRLPLLDVAGAYTALGDKDEAFSLLFRMVEQRSLSYLKVDPPFDGLHSDPRWQELLRRMNLPVE